MCEQIAMAAPLTAKLPPLHLQLSAKKIFERSTDKKQSLQHEIFCVESAII